MLTIEIGPKKFKYKIINSYGLLLIKINTTAVINFYSFILK